MDINALTAQARFMVLRLLLLDLYEAHMFQQSDPVARVDEWAKAALAGLDPVMDESEMPELFKHTALDEMETFYRSLRAAAVRRVEARHGPST